jgi:hypothetical protein
MLQPGIGDLRVGEIEREESGEDLDRGEAVIRRHVSFSVHRLSTVPFPSEQG